MQSDQLSQLKSRFDDYARSFYHDMRSLNDYKLLQLSWVFELYFRETAVLARQRGDVAAIARSLPDDPILDRAVAAVMKRLEE